MILLPVKRLFVDKIMGNPIFRSKYTSMMHKEMQKMGIPIFFTTYSLKHAAIEKLVCLKKELPKINKSARLAMNSTVALKHYSPLAASKNTVCALITKDQGDQKEKINKLLVLKKRQIQKKNSIKKRKNIKMNTINYLGKTKK
jgi:hypothetical protein